MPGTFGSLAGVVWFVILLQTGHPAWFCAGQVASFGLSVWLCGEGERLLHQPDPDSVVLDEIVAIPLCFTGLVLLAWFQQGAWPAWTAFFGRQSWPLGLGVFFAFRLFDIAKPWPVRQSQVLRGGWGITVDDLLAAIYVNALVLGIVLLRSC